jgi:hypothetical protein
VQYEELGAARRSAEQWRTGMASLTALLSAAALITAPDLGKTLGSPWRAFVGGLALAGLLALTYGTWQVMRAAFGMPSSAIPMTGERLRAWEQSQARDAVDRLRQARISFLSGLLLIILASSVAFAAQPRGGPFVMVTTADGPLCGRLGSAESGRIQVTTADGKVHTITLSTIETVNGVSTC